MTDIFLSYAREDAAVADRLASLLETNGLSVWWDRRLVAGDEINATIDAAIERAKSVIVLWSPNSVSSRWVCGEAETAANANKLVPVRIADCKLPIGFRGLHTADVYKSKQQLAELAGMLTGKLRADVPQKHKIELTDASTTKFLTDYKSVMLEQSPSFFTQMSREWELTKRHPIISSGVIIAWLGTVWALSTQFALPLDVVNTSVSIVFLAMYFVFRKYRLSRSPNA